MPQCLAPLTGSDVLPLATATGAKATKGHKGYGRQQQQLQQRGATQTIAKRECGRRASKL